MYYMGDKTQTENECAKSKDKKSSCIKTLKRKPFYCVMLLLFILLVITGLILYHIGPIFDNKSGMFLSSNHFTGTSH